MKELEFLLGLVLLLVGFNVGYYEAGKGLRLEDLRKLSKTILKRNRG